MPLKGFSRDIVQPVGAITLSLLAEKVPRTSITMTNLLVVKAPSTVHVEQPEGDHIDLSFDDELAHTVWSR